jgi:prolyl oligopeptidase
VKDELYICDNNGKELERLYPDFVGTMSAHCRDTHSWLFVTMSGFNTPGTIAYYDFKRPEGQRLTPFRQTKVKGLNPDDFETQQVRLSFSNIPIITDQPQVWYPSKDGTQVPMFIVRHKSTPFDGTAPCLQYGEKII